MSNFGLGAPASSSSSTAAVSTAALSSLPSSSSAQPSTPPVIVHAAPRLSFDKRVDYIVRKQKLTRALRKEREEKQKRSARTPQELAGDLELLPQTARNRQQPQRKRNRPAASEVTEKFDATVDSSDSKYHKIVELLGKQLERFLGAMLHRAVELKKQRLSLGIDKHMLEDDRSLSHHKPEVREGNPRTVLNVPDFAFVGDTFAHGRPNFLSTAVEHLRSSLLVADGPEDWTWTSHNPLRSQLENIKRFFPLEKLLSQRDRKKKEKDKERAALRQEKLRAQRAARRAKDEGAGAKAP